MPDDKGKGKGLSSSDGSQAPAPAEKPKGKTGSKPRASRAGTRSVSTLNAEQLARKRANDREAQRAIRHRTREHVERLERRIKELSGEDDGDPQDPALAAAQRRNSELEEELRILKATLSRPEDGTNSPDIHYPQAGYNIPSIETPSVVSYPGPWALPNINIRPPVYAPAPVPVPQLEASWPPEIATPHDHPGPRTHTGYEQVDPSILGSANVSYGSEYGTHFVPSDAARDAVPVPSILPDTLHESIPPPTGHTERRIPFRGTRTNNLWPAPGTAPSISRNLRGAGPSSTTYGMDNSFASQIPLQGPVQQWEAPVQISKPVSLAERLMIGVIQQMRTLKDSGVSGAALIGPRQPSLAPLLQPDSPKPAHAITLTISEIVRVVPFRGFPERIATLIVTYPVFQWLIAQSDETYARLPAFFRPQHAQLNTSHPLWVALIGWPKLRDIIITNQNKYATDEFEYLYGSSINLNWPYRSEDIVEQIGDDWQVTDAFHQHTNSLENWSLDEPFQRRYPELRDVCRFTEYPPQG